MLRFAGSLMICAVCTMYGFNSANKLKCRRDFLNAFITSLSVLETEIAFGKNDLGGIFRRMDDCGLCNIYGRCAENIKEHGIKRAWDDAAAAAAEQMYLKNPDRDALLSLGRELGMSDVEGQKRAIKRTAELAGACAVAADEDYRRLGRAYRGCGFMAGLFFVLMLM